MRYQAFISYRHSALSRAHAVALESALKRYAKPLFRPPIRIFRDEQVLRPGDKLASTIRGALADSAFLIYLASKEAAESPWVREELLTWCDELGRRDQLIVAWLDDELATRGPDGGIDWQKTNALPAVLEEHIAEEPIFIDLRDADTEERRDLRDPEYRAIVNGISALFRGVTPEEMTGSEIQTYRRNRRLRNMGIAAVALFAVIASILGVVAVRQRDAARLELLSSRLTTHALREGVGDETRAVRILERAREIHASAAVQETLLSWYLTRSLYTAKWSFPGDHVQACGFVEGGATVTALVVTDKDLSVVARQGVPLKELDTVGWARSAQILRGGTYVLVNSDSGLHLHDLGSTDPAKALRTPDSGIEAAQISDDLRLLVTVDETMDNLTFFTLPANDPEGEPVAVHRTSASDGSFWMRPGHRQVLVTQTRDGAPPREAEAVLLDETCRRHGQPFREHEHEITAASFSADGQWLVTGDEQGNLVLRPVVADGESTPIRLRASRGGAVHAVACSRDGELVAAGAGRGRIVIWDALGQVVRRIDSQATDVSALAFSSDGSLLLSADQVGGTVWAWSTHNPFDEQRVFKAHDGHVSNLAWLSSDDRIMSGAYDGHVRCWDAQGEMIWERDFGARIYGLATPASGDFVVVVGEWNDAVLLAPDGTSSGTTLVHPKSQLPQSSNGHGVWRLLGTAVSRDGSRIATIRADGVHLWRRDGGHLAHWGTDLASQPTEVRFATSDGRELVVATLDGRVLHLGLAEDRGGPRELVALRVYPGHRGEVSGVDVHLATRRVATACADEMGRVFGPGGALAHPMQHAEGVAEIRFHPDGRRCYTVVRGGGLLEWRDGERVRQFTRTVLDGSGSIAVSPDGERVAVSDGGFIRVYTTRPTMDADLATDRIARFTDEELGITRLLERD